MGDISIIQALLVFVVAFIMGIDQFSFLESLYQPIVTCPIIGAILGNFELFLDDVLEQDKVYQEYIQY